MKSRPKIAQLLGPGLLVAATGVGAGDLATGAFPGSTLGVAIAWAALVGAFLKYVLSEGLARWQIATGQSILEGALHNFPRPVRWVFLLYLLAWSWFVGSALISGCGAATHALIPIFDPVVGKRVFGVLCSLVGLAFVLRGGFALFERCMRVCIVFMFVTVITTAALLVKDWGALATGMFIPTIPQIDGEGIGWTMALMGGVGGTLTIICYGYWIREIDRDGPEDLPTCRIDLAIGYGVTGLFGVAMVVLGSGLDLGGQKGADLVIRLADHLAEPLGPIARWAFLIGAWGAFFSSLLGVWQAVPYVFADYLRISKSIAAEPKVRVDTRNRSYRSYLIGLALMPMLGLWTSFRDIQQYYAVLGALFLPLLALALLVLNNRRHLIGEPMRSRWPGNLVLIAVLGFFMAMAVRRWMT